MEERGDRGENGNNNGGESTNRKRVRWQGRSSSTLGRNLQEHKTCGGHKHSTKKKRFLQEQNYGVGSELVKLF